MRRITSFAILAAVGIALPANASVFLNEVYASHAGTDDREFIELIGTPGEDLSSLWVAIVEGETAAGTLDQAWSLAGEVMPGDGYYVLADDGTPNQDFSIGTDNNIENGTETYYLLSADATGAAAISSRIGTDVDLNDDGLIFSTTGEFDSSRGIQLLDLIAAVDPDFPATDQVFDGADTRGPDGSFFPAGLYRTSDYPNDWNAGFLNFDDATIGTTDPTRPTPGGMNVPEPTTLVLLALGGLVAVRRR